MSGFEDNKKKHIGKFLFIPIIIALVVVFFMAQKNTGTPRQTEVQVELPAVAPIVPMEPALTTPPAASPAQENAAPSPESPQNGNTENAPASQTSPEQTSEVAPQPVTEATQPGSERQRRPTPSKIPVAQITTPQPENQNASESAVTAQNTPVDDALATVNQLTASITAPVQTPAAQSEPAAQNTQMVLPEASPQIASVSIQNGIVHFRFAEDKSHVADGARNALESVASSARSGRYLVISPAYEQSTPNDTKLAQQRILSIKKVLADLNAPEQQIIVLKPQGNTAEERIDVFVTPTNTYTDAQLWKLQ